LTDWGGALRWEKLPPLMATSLRGLRFRILTFFNVSLFFDPFFKGVRAGLMAILSSDEGAGQQRASNER
jgi:hypothetical protein